MEQLSKFRSPKHFQLCTGRSDIDRLPCRLADPREGAWERPAELLQSADALAILGMRAELRAHVKHTAWNMGKVTHFCGRLLVANHRPRCCANILLGAVLAACRAGFKNLVFSGVFASLGGLGVPLALGRSLHGALPVVWHGRAGVNCP